MSALLRYFICAWLSMGLMACSDHSAKIGADEEAVAIMTDVYLLDHIVRKCRPTEQDSVRTVLMQNLLKIHNLDTTQLDSLVYLYQLDNERYTVILQKVEEKIKNYKNQLDTTNKKDDFRRKNTAG